MVMDSEEKGKIKIDRFTWGFLETNMYVLQAADDFLVIDPIDNVEILEKLKGSESLTVLLTHEHFDHICGLNKLREIATYKVIASQECSERIKDAKTNLSAYADVLAEIAEKQVPASWTPFCCESADFTFVDEYSFAWAGHLVKMIATPGHSAGSCCILIDDMLFSGDTILENINITGFPGGSRKKYREVTVPILKYILPKVSFVYPGHGDAMSGEDAMRLIEMWVVR